MEYLRLGEVSIEKNIGKRIYITCIVRGVEVRPMRSNGDSMVFTMKDKNVEYEGRIFSVSDEVKENVKNGNVYDIVVDVKPYDKGKGGISCIIENGGIKQSAVPPEDFADWVENIQTYYDKISSLMQFIKDSKSGQVACHILTKRWNKFSTWPAATGMHHTSLGGLMMHTACVAEKCYLDGNYYNSIYGKSFINLKTLVSAALLHDVMKTEELDVDTGESKVEYSLNASLETHVVAIAIEARMVAKELGFDDNDYEIRELEHCLLAHHGSLEWGSPITPNTPEAYILNYADMLDAEVWRFNRAFKGMSEHESKSEWVHGGLKVYYRPTIGDVGLTDI